MGGLGQLIILFLDFWKIMILISVLEINLNIRQNIQKGFKGNKQWGLLR